MGTCLGQAIIRMKPSEARFYLFYRIMTKPIICEICWEGIKTGILSVVCLLSCARTQHSIFIVRFILCPEPASSASRRRIEVLLRVITVIRYRVVTTRIERHLTTPATKLLFCSHSNRTGGHVHVLPTFPLASLLFRYDTLGFCCASGSPTLAAVLPHDT